jgi:cell division protein FtsL
MSGWSSFMRQATMLCGLLAVALAVVLMAVKYQVQALEEELAHLNDRIAAERQTVRVLQAEFSLLTEPERLRRLATVHLGLVPVDPGQLATFGTLDRPVENGEGNVAANEDNQIRPARASGVRP